MPSRVSGAPFCIPRRLDARPQKPARSSSSAGIGDAASPSQRSASRSVRPEVAAARNSAHNRSLAAGPQMSRLCSSSTVKTKWAASRVAASLVRSPASRSAHHNRGEPVTRRGSNTHTVPPALARGSLVAAHRSARTLVAATGPGADRMCGTASVVVFPERGAMTAIVVSSQDAYRAGPRPDGLSRSPSRSPVSAGDSLRGLTAASDGRSRIAFLAAAAAAQVFDLRVAGQRGDRVLRARDAAADEPPRHRHRRCGGTSQDEPGRDDKHSRRARPRLGRAPAQKGKDPVLAERGNITAGQRRRGPRRQPGQPGQGGQAPAGHTAIHTPAPLPDMIGTRGPGGCLITGPSPLDPRAASSPATGALPAGRARTPAENGHARAIVMASPFRGAQRGMRPGLRRPGLVLRRRGRRPPVRGMPTAARRAGGPGGVSGTTEAAYDIPARYWVIRRSDMAVNS